MTSLYIATTGLAEFWSRKDPVLLLGPWCRPGLRKFEPPDYEEFPCIWDNAQPIAEAEGFCWDLFRRWIPRVGEVLNGVHRVEHSRRYWEVLLSVWFLHFINVLYDRYLLLRSAAQTWEHSWTTTLPRSSYFIPATSFAAVKRFAYDDAYNLQIFSEVARFLNLPRLEQAPAGSDETGATNAKGARKRMRRFLGNARSDLLRATVSTASRLSLALTGRRNGGMLYVGGSYGALDLLSVSVPAGMRMAFPGHSETHGAGSERRSLDARIGHFGGLAAENAAGFAALLLASIPYFIPRCFLEGYALLAAGSQERFGPEPKALVFDSPSLYGDPEFLEYAARCAEAGKRLASIQHGGAYGHTLSSPAERIEVELCEKFFSFGWKDDRFPEKVLPLPNSHLCSLKRSRKPNAAILYISFFGKKYLHRLVSVPHAAQWDAYLDYCETFIESLRPETADRIRFRPYFSYGGYSLPPKMESLMNGDRRENRPASRAILDCRLAVIDHASTSWIEALACNVPTVLFWNPLHWRFRPAAQPSIERLARAGILHFDPAAAARKVEEVYDKAEAWWAEREIQSARSAFCERYAWTTPNWRGHWIRALKDLDGRGRDASPLPREARSAALNDG